MNSSLKGKADTFWAKLPITTSSVADASIIVIETTAPLSKGLPSLPARPPASETEALSPDACFPPRCASSLLPGCYALRLSPGASRPRWHAPSPAGCNAHRSCSIMRCRASRRRLTRQALCLSMSRGRQTHARSKRGKDRGKHLATRDKTFPQSILRYLCAACHLLAEM